MKRTARARLSLLATLGALACRDPLAVSISITNEGATPSDALGDVYLHSGVDERWWPSVAPGETVHVDLEPGADPPTVTLNYQLDGQKRFWRGPTLQKGHGYKLGVRIASGGTVTQSHCQIPCSLP